MNFGRIIAIAGNQTTTIFVLRELLESGYEIEYLINVGPEMSPVISDYIDLSDIAKAEGIRLVRPTTYEMKDSSTKALFESLSIDILISVGWQRLVPEWLLDSLTVGAYGMHGSAEPLPKGRGRSPMNWSILENRDSFLTNLFRYDEGVDSGMIVATQKFDIFPWDTIRSLQHKNALSQAKLLREHLPALLRGTSKPVPQPADVKATYYPKREPKDGVINWNDATDRIFRLVRAVTKPYPGAFTYVDGQELLIWEGAPFDNSLTFETASPGKIVAVFHDETYVVQCGDGSFYVTKWEGPDGWRPSKGKKFDSRVNRSWDKLKAMEEDPQLNSHLAFNIDDYSDLLRAIMDGGYTFEKFEDDSGSEGVVFLRHDIDKSIPSALQIAELEHEQGILSTFLFLSRTPLYGLLEPETLEVIRAIHGLGHGVGLHCDERRVLKARGCSVKGLDMAVSLELELLDEVLGIQCSRSVSFHNPSDNVIGRRPSGEKYLSTYDPRFMMPNTKYLSESNAVWREGDPLPVLREGRWPRLQILTHPIWWTSEDRMKPIDILLDVARSRSLEIDTYLNYSNDLWRRHQELRQ